MSKRVKKPADIPKQHAADTTCNDLYETDSGSDNDFIDDDSDIEVEVQESDTDLDE